MTKPTGGLFTRAALCLAVVFGLSVSVPANAAPPSIPAAGYGFGDGAQMTWLGAGDGNRELDAGVDEE